MLVDYHNHTTFCNHAIGPMSYYVAEAERQGLDEFGFSEHGPWMMGTEDHSLCPSREGWDLYCREVGRLQRQLESQQSAMHLRLGMELDYTPGTETKAAEFLKSYPLDYVIGSVHFVTNGRRPDGSLTLARARNMRNLYEPYFNEVRKMVRTGLVDIVGHIDLPKREGDVPFQG